jgi:hypothetical protein
MSQPALKTPPPVRMGDAADMCNRVDRLGNVEQAVLRVERKLDALVEMMKPAASVFGDKSMRIAIGAAVTSSSMQFPRR